MDREITQQPKERPHSHHYDPELDHSFDLVSRIRAAKEAAQREIDAFGDVSEYEVRKIYGQRTDLNYDDLPPEPAVEHEAKPEANSQEVLADQSKHRMRAQGDANQSNFDFETNEVQQPRPNEEG